MRTPEIVLEQLFLKEKTIAGKPETQELKDAMDTIGKSNQEILRAYPAMKMKEAVMAKMSAVPAAVSGAAGREPKRILPFVQNRSRSATFRMATYAAGFCCMAILSLVAVRMELFTAGSATILENGERLKGGGQRLFVYKKIGDSPVPLPAKTKLVVNDIVQISYIAGGDAFGAILSVDGNGVITQHYPDSGDFTAKLSNEGEVSLDFSYKLDNAPKFERFLFVSGKEKISLAEFKKAVKRSAAADPNGTFDITGKLPPKTHVTDILLLK